jgi:hypothetical protein
MLPFTRRSLTMSTSVLLILGGAVLLPTASVAAEPAASPTSTPAATSAPAPAKTAAPTPAPEATPSAPETVAEVAPAPVNPAPTAPAAAPEPTPAAIPNPSGTRITVSSPSVPGSKGGVVGTRPNTTFLGYAAPGSSITITDPAGAVLATGITRPEGVWSLSFVSSDEAYGIQTVTITAVWSGMVDDVLEYRYRLAPLNMEGPTISTPAAPSTTVQGPGPTVPVTFAGTGVPGALVAVFQLPFLGIQLDDLDGHQDTVTIGETTVGADGTWTFSALMAPGEYSVSAAQGLYAENPDPDSPFRSASWSIEYRDLIVVSTDDAASELPETGGSSPLLGAFSLLLMGTGATGILAARRQRRLAA